MKPTLESDRYEAVPAPIERVGRSVLDCALEVHSEIGPGLLEKVYAISLADLLAARGHRVEREVALSYSFRGRRIEHALRADLIVDSAVVVEVKCVEELGAIHIAQLRTYLRATGLALGYVLNFSSPRLVAGLRRVIHTPRRAGGVAQSPDPL